MDCPRFGPLGRGAATRRARHRSVLIADDDPWVRAAVAPFLNQRGFHTLFATDGPAALRCLRLSRDVRRDLGAVDAVIADLDLPGRSGLDILIATKTHRWNVPVLLTARSVSPAFCDEVIRLGAAGVLSKPLSLPFLAKALALVVADLTPLRSIPCLGRIPPDGSA